MNQFDIILVIVIAIFCGLDVLQETAERRRTLVTRKYPLHAGLFVAGELVQFAMPLTVASVSYAATQLGVGLGPYINPLGWPVALAIWMLALTLVMYFVHWAEHRYSALWAFHRVHHNDEYLEASTAFRHHPVEDIVSIAAIAVLGFVLNPPLTVLLGGFLIGISIDLFSHSRLELPAKLSSVLEWVIVTPRQHRVHHSPLAIQTDSNFGGTFTFWDRLFGTYRLETPAGVGLDDPNFSGDRARDFDTLLFEPFQFLWRRTRQLPVEPAE